MTRIQRYILRKFLTKIAVVMVVVASATLLLDVVEQLRNIGNDVSLGLLGGLSLALLKLPMLIEQTFPFVLLTASILCFSQLNNRSELSIFRSVGMSAWRFIFPALLVSALLGVMTIMVINPLGASTQAQFNTKRADLLGRELSTPLKESGIWLKQETDTTRIFINAKSIKDNGLTFDNVRFIIQERLYENGQPTQALRFDKRIDAESAQIFNGFWQLSNITEYTLDAPAKKIDRLAIPTNINPAQFLKSYASPATIDFWRLPSFISQTKKAGLSAMRYESRLHGLLALPAMFVTMTLVGLLACLRLNRSSGTGQLIATGVVVAFALYFLTQFSTAIGSSGAVPIWLAAWAPILVVLFLSLFYIAKTEDG